MTVYGVSAQEKDLAKYARAIQQLGAGRSNASGTVTLAASATSTTVSAIDCAPGSAVFLFPTTADAAAAVATTYVPAATVTKQQFIIQHASAASVDRTFFYVCLG